MMDWSIRQQIDTSIDGLFIYTTLELEYINMYYYISSDTFYFYLSSLFSLECRGVLYHRLRCSGNR